MFDGLTIESSESKYCVCATNWTCFDSDGNALYYGMFESPRGYTDILSHTPETLAQGDFPHHLVYSQ